MPATFGGFAGEHGGTEGTEKVRNQLLCVKDLMLEQLKGALPVLSKVVAGTEDGWAKVLSSPAAKLLTVSPVHAATSPTSPRPPVDARAAAPSSPEPPTQQAAAQEQEPGPNNGGLAVGRVPDDEALLSQPVAHPGRYAAPPLSALRLSVVTLIADLVSLDPTPMLDALPLDVWRVLAALFFQYPHSDMFHAQFYRLVFAALRHQHDPTLRYLLQRCRFVAHLIARAQDGAVHPPNRTTQSASGSGGGGAVSPHTPPPTRRRHRSSPAGAEAAAAPPPARGPGAGDGSQDLPPTPSLQRADTPRVLLAQEDVPGDEGGLFHGDASSSSGGPDGLHDDRMVVEPNEEPTDEEGEEEEEEEEEEPTAAGGGATDDEALWLGVGSGPGGGTVIRMCNAIRLQAAALPPSAYLRNFLQSHESWRQFLPRLMSLTVRQQQPGLGMRIEGGNMHGLSQRISFDGLGSTIADDMFGLSLDVGASTLGQDFGPDQVNHGSQFAAEMGFEGEVEWVAEEPAHNNRKSSKRKRAKKKAKKNRKANGAKDADGGEGSEADE